VIGMCERPQEPASVDAALAMLDRALDALNAANVASAPAEVQAGVLRALERASAKHTAARARALAAFTAQGGYEDDGHGSARVWLKWQARITDGAAAETVAWVRRLAAHPVIAQALAGGEISPSWARAFCAWNDRLPAERRNDADAILTSAGVGGADLADLAGLAREMYERSWADGAGPGDDDAFDDRYLHLGTTFGGAGRTEGDLTPGCAAALSAVLEALGKKAGPEDTRTAAQRRHDALEEACRRLLASRCLPARAGQSTQLVLHMGLGQLRGLPGAAAAEAAWAGAAAGPGDDCDATIVPVVTGHVDRRLLDRLAAALLGRRGVLGQDNGRSQDRGAGRASRRIVLAAAADLLSGPAGLAAYLRTGLLSGPAASISLPLDVGAATEIIPAHLRRAVTARDQHCRFPGCAQPAAACQPHHIVPRSKDGPTSLTNLLLLCTFHHLIAIHRWGWDIVLHPDGTVTATSPGRRRVLHSHGPPSQAA
jgi:hypothetical protein